ncbi:PREDICTED: uncharacterized protein LOC106747634 [Dinoponera quadriceps]|uniref:Uncharacterized protein LOC106747634 n=1 Tax=Dinoponera quadriceps TaxID=609295 RepID=A0A6P3XRZ9_DINQU|nr:PREDICTED: uncharacterized protein LOC106747634 [Dinoponera quadriceps]
MSNPNKQVFEYRGPRTAERYNQFFNPNICHVCKSVRKDNFISCDQCCLILYCNEEHKAEHRAKHAESCAILKQVLQENPQEYMRSFSDWQHWIQSREKLLIAVAMKLCRPMEQYEKQMILWSKTCVVCYLQTELKTCQRCFSANYCDVHANAFRKKHNEALCSQLMLSLNIDIETIVDNVSPISYDFLSFINRNSYFEEMLEFCIEHILTRREENMDWIAKDYVLSDYLSEPLTIYFGFKQLYLLLFIRTPVFVIHLLRTDSLDIRGLPAWEILLHLIPEIIELEIVMIISELELYDPYICNLCNHCTRMNKKLSFYFIRMRYGNYAISSVRYKIPRVIFVFLVDFNKQNLLFELKELLINLPCPLFISFTHKQKAHNFIINVKEALNMNIEPELNRINHFSGLVPHKNKETGNTYFRNEYLIIYTMYSRYVQVNIKNTRAKL